MNRNYCAHCGAEVTYYVENESWYHVDSRRVACDRGPDGRITLARPA